ncbi:uncharacterized protein V1516DRAFT_675972 [Lipomyces oligophaga]|uniref:uncharacterized protein n=1 Tax=Lipomyces oligophaga TaxID=45792 RepID=UPI0034CDE42B
MVISADPGGGNIKVVVRVRPFNSRELTRHAKCVVRIEGTQTILDQGDETTHSTPTSKSKPESPKSFKFDKSYWSFDPSSENYANQEQVFADLGRPLLENAFLGFNNCIFAYGQTGSGKSYSMMGSNEDPGVIPRICQSLFSKVDELANEFLHFTVEVSYLEIYNERVRDLLNPKNRASLRVREHPSLGPYVEDLSRLVVGSFAEIEELMDEGNKARTVAATNMNETSSRSHAVFTLTLTQHSHDSQTNLDSEKVSRISLVDLAGSERASATGAVGVRLKEGTEINRSLSSLGRVIRALADISSGRKQQREMVVPYRDSALTWLLKDSLGGNSMTAMIATISPADINFDETLSTLRYADSAKRIKNHAIVNEDPNAKLIRELQSELNTLRNQLKGSDRVSTVELNSDTSQLISITTPDGIQRMVTRTEIAEQLNASEKLLSEINQTWEERLARTKEIQVQRESALEEMGINIERGFIGVHTPKNFPYLVNLSDDPLLAECLVYNIKPGVTQVGNVDVNGTVSAAQIRLHGSKILMQHCSFENKNDTVTITPNEGASVMVNGSRLRHARKLHTGDRIILGDFHIFRFSNPHEAMMERKIAGTTATSSAVMRRNITRVASPMSQLSETVKSSSTSDHSDRASSVASDYVDFPSFEDAVIRSVTPANSDNPVGGSLNTVTDWSLARLEAARTYLGSDSSARIESLTDEELDQLFDEMQRVRSSRKPRPQSAEDLYVSSESPSINISSRPDLKRAETDPNSAANESVEDPFYYPSSPLAQRSQSFPVTDSLKPPSDEVLTALSRTSTSSLASEHRSRNEFETRLRNSVSRSSSVTSLRDGLKRRTSSIYSLKLPTTSSHQYTSLPISATSTNQYRPVFMVRRNPILSEDEKKTAAKVIKIWRRIGLLRMTDAIFRNTKLLKKAQILSNDLELNLQFQFTIVDEEYVLSSPYDLVINEDEPEDDTPLARALKPCVAVRILDYDNRVIKTISLEKFDGLVKTISNVQDSNSTDQIYSMNRNPFTEKFSVKYSFVGEASVPMIGAINSKLTDISCDVFSPYTMSVIGILHLTLEPSNDATSGDASSIAIIVHIKSICGFSEREFTDVHLQLFLAGSSDASYPGRISSSQLVSGFGEDGPVIFDSHHGISLGALYSANFKNGGVEASLLHVKIFAKVTGVHLDKLRSWDDMQEMSPPESTEKLEAMSNIAGVSGGAVEHHDAFAKIQILELTDSGSYEPVDVLRNSQDDSTVSWLHIGIQKRIRLSIRHSSADSFDWSAISHLCVRDIQLIDGHGKVMDSQSKDEGTVELRIISKPKTIANADGTWTITVTGQWDSSAHASIILDRTTPDKCKIQFTLGWLVSTPSVTSPVEFRTNIVGAVLGRSARAPSRLSLFWASNRVLHSNSALFQIRLRPYNTIDMHMLSRQSTYISGEENLGFWKPRTAALVEQYMKARELRRHNSELEHTKAVLTYISPDRTKIEAPLNPTTHDEELQVFTPSETELLKYVNRLWKRQVGYPAQGQTQTMPIASNSRSTGTKFVADVGQVKRGSVVSKEGSAWIPDEAMQAWVKCYIELRRPYLHIYSLPSLEEEYAINIRHCKIGHHPVLAPELSVFHSYSKNTFAVYSDSGVHIFSVRTHGELSEWVLKLTTLEVEL